MSPIKPTKKDPNTEIKVDGRTLRGSRAGGALNECTTAVRLMLPQSSLSPTACCKPPSKAKALAPNLNPNPNPNPNPNQVGARA